MQGERASLAHSAGDGYAAPMDQGDMLDNGEAQTGAAMFPAASLVGAIETLEQTR